MLRFYICCHSFPPASKGGFPQPPFRLERRPSFRTELLCMFLRVHCQDVAVGQNQWYHFGVGAPRILVYFSGGLGCSLRVRGFDPLPCVFVKAATRGPTRVLARATACVVRLRQISTPCFLLLCIELWWHTPQGPQQILELMHLCGHFGGEPVAL